MRLEDALRTPVGSQGGGIHLHVVETMRMHQVLLAPRDPLSAVSTLALTSFRHVDRQWTPTKLKLPQFGGSSEELVNGKGSHRTSLGH